MERKLASIKQISKLSAIDGKDRIELAFIDGWQVIVKKGEFSVGSQCVYVECDSKMPETAEFEFLRSKKFVIKTMKISGVLSQGICFPMSILPVGKYSLEQDVTSILGITKYEKYSEPTSENEKNSKKTFWLYNFIARYKITRKLFGWLLPKKQYKGYPTFIVKTDETRIQNIPSILERKDLTFIAREKVDGTSLTVSLERKKGLFKTYYDFAVCSRNLRQFSPNKKMFKGGATNTITSSTYLDVAEKYKLKDVLMDLIGDNKFVAIQGEIIAPKVQGNKYKVTESKLFIFNLIYPNGKVKCLDGEKLLAKYNLEWCPLINSEYILPDTVNEMLEYATGKSKLYDTLREGLVLRNYEKDISFKAVSPDFLIKNEE